MTSRLLLLIMMSVMTSAGRGVVDGAHDDGDGVESDVADDEAADDDHEQHHPEFRADESRFGGGEFSSEGEDPAIDELMFWQVPNI